ncbi:hypothetical protein HDU98_002260 [Podochytrium sp. JEL0797]|nr:hypothetical protein HDU98_002260 [Podochytrium sp. JEL0797]
MTWDRLQFRGDLSKTVASHENRIHAQFMSEEGYPVYFDPSTKGLPSLVMAVEAFDMSERMFVLPSSSSAGVFEFSFSLLTSGQFQVTLWVETQGNVWINDLDYMRSKSRISSLDKIASFNLTVDVSKSHPQSEIIRNEYESRDPCNMTNVHDLSGRWLNPARIPDEIQTGNIPSPFTKGRGSEMVYLPHACRISYFSDSEARQCLDQKRVVLMGDSTMNELAIEMINHLVSGDSDVWPAKTPVVPSGKSDACSNLWQREFYSNLTTVDGTATQVSKLWSPNTLPCIKDGPGGATAMNDPEYLTKITRALFAPSQIPLFTYPEDPLAHNKTLPTLNETIATGSPTDVFVFNSLLHDMIMILMSGVMTSDYEAQMNKLLKQMKPGTRAPIWVLGNPKIPHANVVGRYFNGIMTKVARKNGYVVMDAHSIQMGRLSGLHPESKIMGELHHAGNHVDHVLKERNPFVHVPVQVLLNMYCTK